MNKTKDIAKNSLTDGVKTPVGVMYAVENPDQINFPGISVYLKQRKDEPAIELGNFTFDQIEKQLKTHIYSNVFDYDAEPVTTALNLNKIKEEE
jgi:hypothetical protein